MKLLFFLHPGTNSRSILLDIIDGCRAAGHECGAIELGPLWTATARDQSAIAETRQRFTRDVYQAMRAFEPDHAFSMWNAALTSFAPISNPVDERVAQDRGAAQTIFEACDVPLTCFWLDAPHWAHGNLMHQLFGTPILRSPFLRHIINNDATASEMREVLGFAHVKAVPYGVHPASFESRSHDAGGVSRNSELEFDAVISIGPGDPPPPPDVLSFLRSDTPDLRPLREFAAARVARKLSKIAMEHAHATDLSRLFPALIESQLLERSTPVLDRLRALKAAHPDAAAAVERHPVLFVRVSSLLREIEAHERAFTASYLSRRFRIAMFGSGDLRAWGFEGTHLGELPYQAMADAYARAPIGINIMRWQDDAGFNIKPFEITASGSACMSMQRLGTSHLFHENELAMSDSPSHAADCLERLLRNRSDCKELARLGRERTLRCHAWQQRAAELFS